LNETIPTRSIGRRRLKNTAFTWLCIAATSASVLVLGFLLLNLGTKGIEHLDLSFVTDPPSRKPAKAGLGPAIWGSIWICTVCALTALPLGVGTAVFLEEYKPRHRLVRRLHGLVQLNISNLAGVPSIVYGIIGLTAFVQMFGVLGNPNTPAMEFGQTWYDEVYDASGELLRFEVAGREAAPVVLHDGMFATAYSTGDEVAVRLVPDDDIDWNAEPATLLGVVAAGETPQRQAEARWWFFQLPFGRGVFAGGLTLMLVILPVVIISSQEALRAVPNSLREGALAAGATKWQMIHRMTLPAAVPGIMTGAILAMSRAIGEAAPILVIAGIVFIRFTPGHLMDEFTAMPLQIYDWAGRPQEEFHKVAATGIIVLLAVLLTFNATAVFIRHKFQKPLQ
jgi:phosphate transport system permease protein